MRGGGLSPACRGETSKCGCCQLLQLCSEERGNHKEMVVVSCLQPSPEYWFWRSQQWEKWSGHIFMVTFEFWCHFANWVFVSRPVSVSVFTIICVFFHCVSFKRSDFTQLFDVKFSRDENWENFLNQIWICKRHKQSAPLNWVTLLSVNLGEINMKIQIHMW